MKKGFTLIELLAVIVILAIIALIATPIILGIINDAKVESNKRSIENYAHAVELAVARYASGANGVIPEGTYKTDASDKTRLNKIEDSDPDFLTVDYKGEKIDATVEITKKGEVKITDASVDNGKTKYNYSEKDGVTKKEDAVTQPSSPFKVSDSGVLLHYERQGDETSVVVPAEVNGIKIKSIAPYAFVQADIMLVNDSTAAIILNKDKLEIANQLGKANGLSDDRIGIIDEFGKGNDPFEILHVDHGGSSNTKISILENNSICYPQEDEQCGISYVQNIDLSEAIYLEKISGSAFHGSDGGFIGVLKSVKFPMNGALKIIGENAFDENQLTEVIIPSSVTNIGSEAFEDNANLKTITVKRANSDGMTLGSYWNGSAEVVYDPN